jgi:hypothetical protein
LNSASAPDKGNRRVPPRKGGFAVVTSEQISLGGVLSEAFSNPDLTISNPFIRELFHTLQVMETSFCEPFIARILV